MTFSLFDRKTTCASEEMLTVGSRRVTFAGASIVVAVLFAADAIDGAKMRANEDTHSLTRREE